MAQDDKDTAKKPPTPKPEEAGAIHRALMAAAGELYTLRTEHSSLIIGRAEALPLDDEDEASDYPEVSKGNRDYDTWLG